MRILFIHADRLEYEVREPAIKDPEEIDEKDRAMAADEVLVCFATVEARDEADPDGIAASAVKEIRDVAAKVDTKRLVLYPYAHLSSSLGGPAVSRRILASVAASLKTEGFQVVASPFGWYKSFKISAKGHPLSELSREVTLEAAAKPKPATPERFLVLTEDGEEIDPAKFTKASPGFLAVVKKEALHESLPAKGEPAYLRLCKKFGFEWEAMSDAGHMRYGPKAALMFDLAADYARSVVEATGIPTFMVRGTNLFDLNEPAIREHADLFGDRLYTVETEKHRYVMRYAACFQQFAMMKDWTISYKQLPLGALEVADAYRLEQSGEAMLLFRVRRLNMPDFHVLCADAASAAANLEKIHDKIMAEARKYDRDYELLINVSSKKAYEENKDLILRILRKEGKPGLIHFYPEGINFYWTVNLEYMLHDVDGHGREIATVQIDTGNAERFGITYLDDAGKKRAPLILHTAIIGTIERYLYMVLDTAVKMEKEGRKGVLPLWLNPEQVRLLTVSEAHLARAQEVATILRRSNIRCGIDDRNESVPKKVREAKQDWVGYAIVVGDKEAAGPATQATFKPYDREMDADRDMPIGEIIREVSDRCRGMPYRALYFPAELGRRPVF
jgi:threonyl-tRNA synthetase